MSKIARERWNQVWPEVQALAQEHYDEVDGGIEPRRPLAIDVGNFEGMDALGVLWIWAARDEDGKLIGYLSFNVAPDLESFGLVMATQGAWFVSASAHSTNIGWRLMEQALAELKAAGVHETLLHHRTQGRGVNLGKFFESLGATHVKDEYFLWIGD